MLKELTHRQSEVVAVIKRHIDEQGYPPTTREIAQTLGVTPTAAEQHVVAIEKKGALKRTPGIARGIRLLSQGNAR